MLLKDLKILSGALIPVFLILSGCALVIPAAIPVAVSGAGGSVAYSVTNIAYRTFSYPVKKVENATNTALRKMAINVVKRESYEEGSVRLVAETRKLTIYIDLEVVTEATTRIKVNAIKSSVLKDKATATEIIEQAGLVLDDGTLGRQKR